MAIMIAIMEEEEEETSSGCAIACLPVANSSHASALRSLSLSRDHNAFHCRPAFDLRLFGFAPSPAHQVSSPTR